MIQRKKDVDGDLWIPGSITVLGGINSSAYRKTVTRVATTESDVTVLSGEVEVLADAVEGAIHPPRLTLSVNGISRSRSGILSPPALTVTGAYPDGSPYAGRFIISISHNGTDYVGDYSSAADESSYSYPVPATMVVSTVTYYVSHVRVALYESGGTTLLLARGECDVYADGSITALYWGPLLSAPGSGMIAGDYYFDDNVPGSGGGILRYYTGTAPWPELTSSNSAYPQAIITAMTDIAAWATTNSITSGDTLAAATAVINNLVTSTAYIQNLFAQSITIPDGGRIQHETGSGVQKRALRLHDEKIDMVDIPDTVPPTAEQLRFRLGRLGVGGAVLADGELLAQLDSTWSAPTTLCNYGVGHPDLIELSTGVKRLTYSLTDSTYNLVERIWNGSAWGTESVITNANVTSINYSIDETSTRIIYKIESSGFLVEKTWDGASWGSQSEITSSMVFYPRSTKKGPVRVAYRRNSDNYLVEKVYSGLSWGTEVVISSTAAELASYAQVFDKMYIYYRTYSTGYIEQKELVNGVWGLQVNIASEAADFPRVIQLNDGMCALYYVTYSGGTKFIERTLQRYARVGAGIIESGSNTNGSWIKYGDGTMECWKTINSCVGGGVSTSTTLPVTFIYDGSYGVSDNSIGIGKSQVPSVGAGGNFDVWMQGNGYTLYYRSQYAQGAYIHVIGRWK